MAVLALSNRRNITYAERPDSPVESYAGGVGKAMRILDVAWTDRLHMMAGCLGWSEPVFDENGVFSHIKRVPPVAYPAITTPIGLPQELLKGGQPSNYWLYATAVESIEPIGIDRSSIPSIVGSPAELVARTKDENDMFTHAKARVKISYEALPYRVMTDADARSLGFGQAPDESQMFRYVSRTTQPHAEHLTLPHGAMKWGADAPVGMAGVPATNQTGKIVPTVEIVFTWHQVPGLPEQANKMIGCVNSVAITDYSPGNYQPKTYAIGTLLFLGVETKTYRMSTGVFASDVIYRFKHFSALDPATGLPYSPERGHNYFLGFHAGGYGYYTLEDAAGNGVYKAVDLRKLFTLPDRS